MTRQIINYDWRQRISLGNELVTPGYLVLDDWEQLGLPKSLNGKSFLDVGANDGFYSFEAERRGASIVCATDLYKTGIKGSSSGTGWPREGISLAKSYLNSLIDIEARSVYDLDQLKKKFDFILVSNVIAWLGDIDRAVKMLSQVCDDTLVIKDSFIEDKCDIPYMRLEVGKPYLFRHNKTFIDEILRMHGFSSVRFVKQEKSPSELYPFPLAEVKHNAKIYKNFDSSDSKDLFTQKKMPIVIYHYQHRYKLHGVGWIDESDVTFYRYRSNPAVKWVKAAVGSRLWMKLTSRVFKEPISVYSVIASK